MKIQQHITISIVWVDRHVWYIPAAQSSINTTAVTILAGWTNCQTKNGSGMTTHGVYWFQIHRIHPAQTFVIYLLVLKSYTRYTSKKRNMKKSEIKTIQSTKNHVNN